METNETAVAVMQSGHGAIDYRRSTEAASLCKAIVTTTAMEISGRKYVRVEGWQAIAMAHGCVASARDVERIDGGIRAIGEVKRCSDGFILATAEGFVGDDEPTWGKRMEYAKRAMAQTRSISRACRSAFAHVVVMMGAGLETTPAEEVPHGGFEEARPRPTTPKAAPAQAKQKEAAVDFAFAAIVTLPDGAGAKSGTAKNGKPWKRFFAKASDGEFYSTFDTKLGADMQSLKPDDQVRILYEIEHGPKGDSRNVLSIEPVSVASEEPPAATEQAQKDADELGF